MTRSRTKRRVPARRSAEAKSLSMFRRRRWSPKKGKGAKYNRAARKPKPEKEMEGLAMPPESC